MNEWTAEFLSEIPAHAGNTILLENELGHLLWPTGGRIIWG